MRFLIADDDFVCRLHLQELLKDYGLVHVAVSGVEAVEAVRQAIEASRPYQLICLDVIMPEMDGLAALSTIREMERAAEALGIRPAKIVMTTALHDQRSVAMAIGARCDGYVVKPIDKAVLLRQLCKLGVITFKGNLIAEGRP